MNNSPIAATGAVSPDLGVGASPPPQAKRDNTPSPEVTGPTGEKSVATDPIDFRLVIEDDKAAGSFVYKTINRWTGEVVSQIPREQILQLREALDYVAGSVIKTKA